MRILASALALALATVPAAAFACSPAPGYSVPTNLELARTADLVLLGEVVGGTAGVALEPQAAKIEVRPLSVLKGLMPTANLVIPGMYPGDDAGGEGASDPLAFGDAHPSAYSGACIRRIFPPGARVLFFLERVDGEWAPAGGPFSRWAEDVESEAAPWVQLASFYIEAARLPEAERNALLEEQREALSVHQDRPEALAMAADIERSLAGPAAPLKGAPPPLEQPAVTSPEVEPPPERTPEPAPQQSDAAIDSLDEVQQAIDGFGN
jgi:hypothetical protein